MIRKLLTLHISPDNNPTAVVDTTVRLTCPHCQTISNMSAISIPRFEYVRRFMLEKIGICYNCDACDNPVFLKFTIKPSESSNVMHIDYTSREEVEYPKEIYEFEFLPENVAKDFKEAITCYSNHCYNAFAAMCRRTSQTMFMELGAEGKSKVKGQLNDVREPAGIDDETYEILEQIIITGHDGAHPNLPSLNQDRAVTLLELMKDVLYQIFVRKEKLKRASELRKQALEKNKNT